MARFAVTFACAAVMFAVGRCYVGYARVVSLHGFVDDLLGDGVLLSQRDVALFRKARKFRVRFRLLQGRIGLLQGCFRLRQRRPCLEQLLVHFR